MRDTIRIYENNLGMMGQSGRCVDCGVTFSSTQWDVCPLCNEYAWDAIGRIWRQCAVKLNPTMESAIKGF